jgi:hypothetical protein
MTVSTTATPNVGRPEVETETPPLPPGVTYGTLFPRIEFPELTPEGADMVWVEIRNPGMMPPAALEDARGAMADVEVDDQGRPVDEAKAAPAVFGMLAKMIRKWHVYDVMADDDPLPVLPSPPRTAEVVKQAPSAILQRLMEVITALKDPR